MRPAGLRSPSRRTLDAACRPARLKPPGLPALLHNQRRYRFGKEPAGEGFQPASAEPLLGRGHHLRL